MNVIIMMSPALRALYEIHAAASLEKQLCLSVLLKDAGTWKFNPDSGLLSFGGAHFYRAQLLGVEIERTHTWLWSWANTAVRVNSRLLKSTEALRAFGEKHGVVEFVKPQIPLETINSGELGKVAAGICKADAFYRGTQPGSATLLLVEAALVRELWNNTPQRITAIFTQLISKEEIDHRRALTHFLHYKGYEVKANDSVIDGVLPTGEQIHASFDEHGRLKTF
ncbi:MAG: hypothetical protein V1899_04815 [Planctomycetota bacterium]